MVTVAVLVIAALVVGIFVANGGSFSATSTGDQPAISGNAVAQAGLCPADGTTSLSFTVINPLNTSGEESYDQTARIYEVNDNGEALFATLTDTTAGTADLNCGDTYRVRLESTDSANARIDSVSSGDADVIESGRAIEFVAERSNFNLRVDSSQHAGILVRAFDQDQNAFVFADDSDSASTLRATGATFQSTVDNATATALNSGDDLRWTFGIEANGEDVDANDFGTYILVKASTTVYEEPSVSYEGSDLQDVFGQLDTYESRAFSSYDYAYLIPEGASIEDSERDISLDISALSNVNPGASDDIEIAFATVGAVKEVSGQDMRYSASTDASSPTAVFTLQTFGINIE